MRYARGEGVPSQWVKRIWPVEVERWLDCGVEHYCHSFVNKFTKGHEKEASEQGSLVDGWAIAPKCASRLSIQTLLTGLFVKLFVPYGRLIASLGHTLAHVPHSVQASASIL